MVDAMRALRNIPLALVLLALTPGFPLTPLAGVPAHAQMAGRKRLILKDGTYQIVVRWKVEGDRVRYLSAERGDWEEIPYSLIDWAATEKWNKEHKPGVEQQSEPAQQASSPAQDQADAAAIDRAEAAERADQRARMPQVVPGLQLPDNDGIFVLDYFQGIPELVELHQSAGDVNQGGTHNVLRAAINSFHGAQEPVRINGQAARVRLHINDPALYVSLSTGESEQIAPQSALVVNTHEDDSIKDKNSYSSPNSRYAIVRVEVQPGERVIGAVRISRLGAVTQSESIVPTNEEILPGRHWMKLTPREPLPVGEYALMEILGPGVVNLDVWDFGVSPNAPENRHPITPTKSSD